MAKGFTAQELEELKRFDAEVDESELTYEDFLLEDLVEDLLFPEKVVERKKGIEKRERAKEAQKKAGVDLSKKYKEDYAKLDKEAERKRKREWYRRNKERVALQQRDYRIRTGRQAAVV